MREMIEKLYAKKDYRERMGVIYMWVKQEHVSKAEFILLVEAIQKMK